MQTAHRNDSDQTVVRHASYTSISDEGSVMSGDYNQDEDHCEDIMSSELDQDWHEESVLSDISGVTPMSSLVSTDFHTEELIRNAARAVVARMEEEAAVDHDSAQDDSMLSAEVEEDSILDATPDEESFISEQGGHDAHAAATDTSCDGTEETYGSEASDHDEGNMHTEEATNEALATSDETASDADGEDEPTLDDDHLDGSASSHHSDDVFSDQEPASKRSSLNSLSSNPHTDGELMAKPELTQHDSISRAPSIASNAYSLLPEPLSLSSPGDFTPRTPTSKVLVRPPFRTPSSVRAMQMSSPTPSVFAGTPRSSKRPGSRLCTPNHTTKTLTRFKTKKEHPLVLLHVTCLPSEFYYAEFFDSSPDTTEWSKELLNVKESWRLVREKVGDLVRERGILLPHPQDDFEVLEERLLEALELPVRPRARILSCGHYVGPSCDSDSSLSGCESGEDYADAHPGREKWCDICGREVRLESFGIGATKQKRFKVKVYASNGLMRAGAWTAAWKEMERVDVEIEPVVPEHLIEEMEHFASFATSVPDIEAPVEDVPVVEEEIHASEEEFKRHEEAAAPFQKEHLEDETFRETYGSSSEAANKPDVHEPWMPTHRPHHDDSLPALLLAAFKVAMRDQKNILICVLSAVVLILAVNPSLFRSANVEVHAAPTAPVTAPAIVPATIADMPAAVVHPVIEAVTDCVQKPFSAASSKASSFMHSSSTAVTIAPTPPATEEIKVVANELPAEVASVSPAAIETSVREGPDDSVVHRRLELRKPAGKDEEIETDTVMPIDQDLHATSRE